MAGHVHLLYSDTMLGATLQRQLQAAFFHVSTSPEGDHDANVKAVRAEEPEVLALIRGPETTFDAVVRLKNSFPHQALVIMDPVPSAWARAAVLQHGADGYVALPVSREDLTLHLTAHVQQARRLDDSGSTEDVLRLLGFDSMALAMPDPSLEGTKLALSHEDPVLKSEFRTTFEANHFEAIEQPFDQPLQAVLDVDGWVLGAVSAAGWRAVLAAIARTRSTADGRHLPIVIAASALPEEGLETLSRLDVQEIWRGSDPDASLCALVQGHVRRHQQSLQRRQALVQSLDLAITDSLTNLFNQRFMMAHLPLQMQIARQSQQPLSLALLDLDGFKKLNDNYGHLAGDQFLIAVAEHLRQHSRMSDSAIRLGGDEFALVLPRLAAADARRVIERLIAGVSTIRHAGALDGQIRISASVGLVTMRPDDWSLTSETLIAAADHRLYAAKKKGGNQIMDTAPL